MANFLLSAFADEGGSTIEEQIDALKANGIDHIEPRGINGVNIADFTSEMAKELKKRLDDAGIGVSSMGSPFGKIEITDDFAPHFEKFKQCVENACILGTSNIRMFSFYFTKGESHAEYRDEVFERLEKMCDYSLRSGVWCCHENEKEIYGDTAERCLDIYSTLKGRIAAVFDPANFIQCGVDIPSALDMLAPYIRYFHIKDAVYATGNVVPAGKGEGHLSEVVARANTFEGDVFLTLEPHLRVFDGLAALENEGGTAYKLKDDYSYPTNRDAFDAAAAAMKELISKV